MEVQNKREATEDLMATSANSQVIKLLKYINIAISYNKHTNKSQTYTSVAVPNFT